MILSHELMQYLAAAEGTISFRGNPNSIPTTNTCPECGATFDSRVEAMSDGFGEIGSHIVLELSGDVFAVLVGCEGYWCINPQLLGLSAPNWTDSEGNSPALGDELPSVGIVRPYVVPTDDSPES